MNTPWTAPIRSALAVAAPEADSGKLDRLADQLAVTAWLQKRAAAPLSHGTKRALRDLETVSERVLALAGALDTLSRHDLMLVEIGVELQTLQKLHECVRETYDRVKAMECRPAPRGRPKASFPEAVARLAKQAFERATGRPALRLIDRDRGAPIGSFDAFLTQVFSALELDASVDHYVRKVASRRKSAESGSINPM